MMNIQFKKDAFHLTKDTRQQNLQKQSCMFREVSPKRLHFSILHTRTKTLQPTKRSFAKFKSVEVNPRSCSQDTAGQTGHCLAADVRANASDSAGDGWRALAKARDVIKSCCGVNWSTFAADTCASVSNNAGERWPAFANAHA
eukprot:2198693-Pleurochrysis_carterae.AAC.1